MKYLLILLIIISPLSYSCEKESQVKLDLSSEVFSRDSDGIELAIIYPDEYRGASINSLSLVVFQGKDFYMTVYATSLKHKAPGLDIDMESHSWSYLAVKETALKDIEVVASYSWPPAEDGSFIICGPELRKRLSELVGDL